MCTCACVHGPAERGRLPVHSYLPEALFAHGHPLELSLVVGAVHPAEHHHAALLLLAGGGGEAERGLVVRGGEWVAFLKLSDAPGPRLLLAVIAYPHVTQPCRAGTAVVSPGLMGKLRRSGVEYSPKVSHRASER